MPERHGPQLLTARDREILKDIVQTYILSGEPVSSRAVAKHERHGLSAASIRNVMADLEELGLLEQPHTSAGRVPSSAGYHLYIESLMENREVSAEERQVIDSTLAAEGGAERLVGAAPLLLSRLSAQVGIVLTPALGDTRLKAVDFVALSGRKVLCVVVSAGGFVESKLIETDELLSRERLVEISNYLTESFAGRTLREVRERLLTMMAEQRLQVDQLLGNAISLAERGLATAPGREVLVQGTSAVLAHPELSSLDRVRRMLDLFADRERLVALLGQCIEGKGVRVVIGPESDLTSDLGFSLITRPFQAPGGAEGTLAVFGPSRMEYGRVIPLVEYLGERLSEALEESRTI
jgi:heat-inducible transcriptional repressor